MIPLKFVSLEAAVNLMAAVCVPSAMLSSTTLAVTVCGLFQLLVVNVSVPALVTASSEASVEQTADRHREF